MSKAHILLSCGCLLLSGPYLLLATNSEIVGSLHGGHVFRITETRLVRGAPSLAALTRSQVHLSSTLVLLPTIKYQLLPS